jgi:hypothetical protein
LACIANNERVDILAFMTKHVADLSLEELDRLAAEAWFDASQSALKAGVAVVGRDGEKIVKRHPDGRVEILGDAVPLETVESSGAPDHGSSPPNQHKRVRGIAR